MPKIKMITSMAGNNFSYAYGDEIEVTKDVAEAWIAAEIAVPVKVEKKAVKKNANAE